MRTPAFAELTSVNKAAEDDYSKARLGDLSFDERTAKNRTGRGRPSAASAISNRFHRLLALICEVSARRQPEGKTMGMLCYALAAGLAPLEARELRLETLSLMEDLYDLIANVIDHHPVELERCRLLKDLAERAELLDRIWQTAQAMHTEGKR